jgi:hypothetical protein
VEPCIEALKSGQAFTETSEAQKTAAEELHRAQENDRRRQAEAAEQRRAAAARDAEERRAAEAWKEGEAEMGREAAWLRRQAQIRTACRKEMRIIEEIRRSGFKGEGRIYFQNEVQHVLDAFDLPADARLLTNALNSGVPRHRAVAEICEQ